MDKWEAWYKYKEYLKQWVIDHDGREFYGMSPACFDEWLDNEGDEE